MIANQLAIAPKWKRIEIFDEGISHGKRSACPTIFAYHDHVIGYCRAGASPAFL